MSANAHGDDPPGHAGDATQDPADDHGDAHGHDDHAEGEVPLGPIDVAAWGAGALGVLIGVVIAACFAFATGTLTV